MSTDSRGPASLGPSSLGPSSLGLAARAEPAPLVCADATAKALPAPAKKPRRPRPTFEDGALTRVFKFPSKTYPRSSYYVTGTEIIVRIKKARKKWKLIIPKKRVVSYRTNRWFAKPRWIALELTYTQAVKLGLVEARAANAEVSTSDLASPAPAFPAPEAEEAARDEQAAPLLLQPAGVADVEPQDARDELADDDLGDQDGDDHFEIAPDLDDSDEPEALPPLALVPQHLPESAPEPVSEPEPKPVSTLPPAEVPEAPPIDITQSAPRDTRVVFLPPPDAQPLRRVEGPRRPLRRVVAALAAAITGLTVWAATGTPPQQPRPECCTSPIVTGSIEVRALAPPVAVEALEETPPSPTQTTDIARADAMEQSLAAAAPLAAIEEKPESATAAPALPDDTTQETRTVVLLLDRELALPVSPPAFSTAVAAPAPKAAAPADCDGLAAAARGLLITFDYARSRFDPAMAALLDEFAARLRACPSRVVTIEGHTDSDGGAAHNRSLSLRRAQAVQAHLVNAGVDSRQLTAVGFGQSRPAAPNVSPKNKRHNRRAVLVLATQR